MAHPINFGTLTATVAVVGKRVALSSSRIVTPYFEAHFPSTNGGVMYLGDANVTSSWPPRAANSIHYFQASARGDHDEGDWFDLSKIYVDAATAADKVIIQYLRPEG